jgi:anti-sigma factor RsiW
MHCEQASQMMSARLDGRLDDSESILLEGHLATCGTCQAEWRRLQALDSLLISAPMMRPHARLRVEIMTRLARREQARRAIVGGTALGLGAVALMLLALGPTLVSLLGATGIAPALVSGGPETVAQLLTLLGAAGRAVLVLAETFAGPLAFLSLCSLMAALALNSLWMGAVRYLRAAR